MGKSVKSIGKSLGNVFKGDLKSIGRLGLGVATLGGSELVKAGVDYLKPKAPGGGGGFPIPDNQSAVDARTAVGRQAAEKLIADLQAQSAGTGPSLATAQLKSAQDRGLAQTLATAAAMRGGSAASNQRQVLTQKGDADRQFAQDAAMARLQEQQQAQGALANLALGQQGAGLQQIMDPATLRFNAQNAAAQIQAQKDAARKSQQTALLGGLLGAAGTIGGSVFGGPAGGAIGGTLGSSLGGMFGGSGGGVSNPGSSSLTMPSLGSSAGFGSSDERRKKDIKPAKKEVNSFLKELNAREYSYRDPEAPGAAPGRRVGIMAQDLEKSSMGRALVKNTPNGKMVDTVQGFGAVLAAQSELMKRIESLEKKKKA